MRKQCSPKLFVHINSPCKYVALCSRNRYLRPYPLMKNSYARQTVDTRK
jgi:hypothetical protein